MTLVNAYCTLDEFQDRLQTGATWNEDEDALHEQAINTAARAVDEVCSRRFWLDPTVTVKTYRVRRDAERVGLYNGCEATVHDIGATTGLIIKTDPNLDGTWGTTWDAADYQLEPLNAMQSARAWWQIVAVGSKRFEWNRHRSTLQVTARHGWSSVPTQVKEACLMVATGLEQGRKSPGGVLGFADFGPVRLPPIIARDVALLLGPFMLPGV